MITITLTPLLATSVTMSLMMPRVTVVSSLGAGDMAGLQD